MSQMTSDQFNFVINSKHITDIFESRSVAEIKASVQNFLTEAEAIRDAENGMLLWFLCQELERTFSEWVKPYLIPNNGAEFNTVIVPPEHAPIMMLSMTIPFGDTLTNILKGMEIFITRCNEFTAPIEAAITPDEIYSVLDVAEEKFKIVSLIAPQAPLLILRLNNSHFAHNSQCGIPSNPEHEAVIFAFHPRDVSVFDRVFIFAHELGHALHLSLTHDIDTLPDKFDDFNNALGINAESLEHKPEMFADAVAYAILGDKRLHEHLPKEFHNELS
ncbi:hypothetical protein FACS1894105_06750 [Clostridia bacterium]|nr:hypothetical protein FACS1894105_06750 [Clostridia bacterium]